MCLLFEGGIYLKKYSNKHCPRVLAMATICCRSTIAMQIISDEDHQASARAVCVVQLISMADSRTD